jgi:hypothetical protein
MLFPIGLKSNLAIQLGRDLGWRILTYEVPLLTGKTYYFSTV